MHLSCHDLTKTYGSGPSATHALAGVDLRVEPGSLAIMGPSGSGKTTLLHCLAGILRPTAGNVLLDGADITRMPDAQRTRLRRSAFGFVFQSGQLLAELPANENVALPLLLGGLALRPAVAKADALLVRLGLDGLQHRRPGELSGGQAQRVAIARALITDARVVFADEPTGALDQKTGADVLHLLVDAVTSAGAALVVVTHDPHVARLCERTIVMADGRIVGDFTSHADAQPSPLGEKLSHR